MILSTLKLTTINFSQSLDIPDKVFIVKFQYPGTSNSIIERKIVIPLEAKLNQLEDLKEMRSEIIPGTSTTKIIFPKNTDAKNTLLTISQIADQLYRTLPDDVQHPEIYSSEENEEGFMTFVFTSKNLQNLHKLMNRNLKRNLETLEGISTINIAGGAQEEFHLKLDENYTASYGLYPWNCASLLNQEIRPLKEAETDTSYSTIYYSFSKPEISVKNLMVPDINSVSHPAQTFSELYYGFQKPESVVRINGEQCLSLVIKTDGSFNHLLLSRKISSLMDDFVDRNQQIKCMKIYDQSELETGLFRKVFIALFETLFITSVIIIYIFKSVKLTLVNICFVITNLIWTTALLSFLQFSVTENVVTGITLSIGLILDNSFLITEQYLENNSSINFKTAVISSLTTLIIACPLYYTESLIPGAKTLCITVFLSILISLIEAVIFLPFFLETIPEIKTLNFSHIFLPKKIISIYPVIHLKIPSRKILSLLLSIFIFSIFIIPKNISAISSKKIIFSSIEFNPEKSAEDIDRVTQPFINEILQIKGIDYIQTEAHRGTLSIILIKKSGKKNENLRKEILSKTSLLPEGTLHFPLTQKKKASKKIEVIVKGPDHESVYDTGKILSRAVSGFLKESQVVLNYKEHQKIYCVIPDLLKLSKNNISVSDLFSYLRWNIYNPVAVKYFRNGSQIDVRVGLQNYSYTLENLHSLKIPFTGTDGKINSIPVTSLTEIQTVLEPSCLFRYNQCCSVYFTIEAENITTQKLIEKCSSIFSGIKLPEGTTFTYDLKTRNLESEIKRILTAVFFSMIIIFLLATFINEKPLLSLYMLLTVPASLSLPLLIISFSSRLLESGDFVAMIFVSGIAINNSVILSEASPKLQNKKIRLRIKSLVSSTLTTVSGSVPVLITSSGTFSKSLSFFMLWGVLSSFLIAVFLFPGVLDFKNKKRYTLRFKKPESVSSKNH